MGQKKLSLRSDEGSKISGADNKWNSDMNGGDHYFVGKVYAMLKNLRSGSATEARGRSTVTRSSPNNVKISFISLPLSDVRVVDIKHDTARLPWRWSWRLWLPLYEDAEPGEAETAVNHIYAGTMARTVSQVGIHPVDTVKTRMQVRDPPKKLRKWRQNISANAIGLGPVGIDNWFLKGPGDLFRGVTGAILGTIPNALLYFATYEVSKRKMKKLLPENWDGPIHVASASLGTVVASIVRVPADTLKHRVQAYMHSNVFEAFGTIVAAEGIGGVYKGFWPTLMRDVPEIAIQFGVYEKLRSYATKKRKVSKLTTPEHLLLGAFAGAIAATCTMPLDLVKTRQQCGISASIPSIVVSVIHEKGVAGLFTGLGSRVLHVSLMSALFFSLFEYCKLLHTAFNSKPGDVLLGMFVFGGLCYVLSLFLNPVGINTTARFFRRLWSREGIKYGKDSLCTQDNKFFVYSRLSLRQQDNICFYFLELDAVSRNCTEYVFYESELKARCSSIPLDLRC